MEINTASLQGVWLLAKVTTMYPVVPYILCEFARMNDSPTIHYRHIGTSYEILYIYVIGFVYWYRVHKKIGIDLTNCEFVSRNLYGVITIEKIRTQCWNLWLYVCMLTPPFLLLDLSIYDTYGWYTCLYKRGQLMFLFSTMEFIFLEYIYFNRSFRIKYLEWATE